MSNGIVVVGSLNMDFVVSVEHLPAPGQTVPGDSFQMIPGGKGANQACAAARLSQGRARVSMVGRVGADVFGERLRQSLEQAGANTGWVRVSSEPTGVALILVARGGINQIAVAAGANGQLRPEDVSAAEGEFAAAEVVLVQLESPLETVATALRLARRHGATTILDPAPARRLPQGFLDDVDVLTPNESEALVLAGRAPGEVRLEEARALGERLLAEGAGAVLLKLGERGAYYVSAEYCGHFPAPRVTAVDSTAAGDTFNGALAAALAEGMNLERAIGYANAAAALSVTRCGAQASIPSRVETESLLERGLAPARYTAAAP